MSLTDTDSARTALVGVFLVALGVSMFAGTTVAVVSSSDGRVADTASPTVQVSNAELSADGTTTADVVLSTAPNGLAGYAVEVHVDGDAARIKNASYPDTFGMTTPPSVGADGRTVTLEAADLNQRVEPGASDVVLATVELAGVSAGAAKLRVEPLQFDADGGDAVRPAAGTGTATVTGGTAGSGAATGDGSPTAAERQQSLDTDSTGSLTSFALPALIVALALVVAGAAVLRWRRD